MPENFLIIGNDEYIKEQETVKIKRKFLAEEEDVLNYSVHESPDFKGFTDSLGTMPFISDKRVVVLKDPKDLPSEMMDALEKYLAAPLGSTILIIQSEETFERSKFYKKISSALTVVRAGKPTPVSMRKKIKSFFIRNDVNISDHAVNLIVELKGDDTAGIKSELEKLLAFSNGEEVTVNDVENLVGRSVTETVFKLVDAINDNDISKAYLILNDMYDQKKNSVEVIGYLGWYVKMLKSIKYLSHRGMGINEIASELGRSPGHAKRLSSQASRWSDEKLHSWSKLLFNTDRDIKKGLKNQSLAMDVLISQMGYTV